MTKIVENVTCTACSCLCDDLVIEINDNGQFQYVGSSCSIADNFYSEIDAKAEPTSKIDGEIVAFEDAVQAATEVLQRSQSPLIFGTEFQASDVYRTACVLADKIGATIDSYGSESRAGSMIALQTVGMSTATLGELKNRADLVLFWGCDPMRSHPRLYERILKPAGQFIPEGRSGRALISLHHMNNSTSALCDSNIQYEPGREYEFISALRAQLKDIKLGESPIAGVASKEVVALAEKMKSCQYGVVFYGSEFSEAGHMSVEVLFQLVRELNGYTRFVASSLEESRSHTAANVLAWQSGFPGCVNVATGYPRYNPGEYSANEFLERKEADAVVLLGSSALSYLSEKALQNLESIPSILLMGPHEQSELKANVEFLTGIPGIHGKGTGYRLDDVPIPLKHIVNSSLPSADQVLQEIFTNLLEGN